MNNNPIGVFDSGLGGISVLRELYALMPNENYIYYGDCLNAPYGTKTNSEIMQLSENCIRKLADMGCKAIVIACNTATSVAAKEIRSDYDIPVIGIEPAVKPAALENPDGKIIVMATPMTLKKEKFRQLSEAYSDVAEIIPLPCPGLVEIIEKGHTNGREINDYLKKLFEKFNDVRIDAIVLGCTHYPHVKKAIKKAFDYDVKIYDGGEGTAKETKRRLICEGIARSCDEKGEIRFISSKPDDESIDIMKELFELR